MARTKFVTAPPHFTPVQERILLAFVDLCFEEGLTNVTLQKVAARSKVAFGTVRYHFAGEKTDLLRAGVFYVVRVGQEYIQNYLLKAATRPNFNSVHGYLEGTFQWFKEQPKLVSYMFNFYYHCTTKTDLLIDNRAFLETARLRLSAQIYESVGRGIYKKPKDVDKLAKQIHALLVGGVLVAASERTPSSVDPLRKAIVAAADTLLNH